jgi:hypothetical protein
MALESEIRKIQHPNSEWFGGRFNRKTRMKNQQNTDKIFIYMLTAETNWVGSVTSNPRYYKQQNSKNCNVFIWLNLKNTH